MEALIDGDELTVAVLGEVALPSIRIVPPGAYYDYHAKYVADSTQYICPGLERRRRRRLRELALARLLGGRLLRLGARRRDARSPGWNFLLEVNTSPGMTSHSLVPKAARQVGIEFDELVWKILEMTM